MVDAALESPGCVAARITGGGFGGAAVALGKGNDREPLLAVVAKGYRRRTGRDGTFFTTQAAEGATVLPATH